MVETCAKHLITDQLTYLKFMVCLETVASTTKKNDRDWKAHTTQCALDLDIAAQAEPIWNCTSSTQGNEWQHEIAVATDNLSPKHKWVPWIVVDGVYNDD